MISPEEHLNCKVHDRGSLTVTRPCRRPVPVTYNASPRNATSTRRNRICIRYAAIWYWCAWPSTHIGHELIAAGMLIMAGGGNGTPLGYDELEQWTRVGYERG
jgi:hypothetical protein